MSDSEAKQVYLPDADPSTFIEILRFMYGAPLKVEMEEAVSLWNLADHLQLSDVCSLVEKELISNMTVDWAIRALQKIPFQSFPLQRT
jgi:hypothetical protein